jgi:DNA-binding beta-propeller fold protein YncE
MISLVRSRLVAVLLSTGAVAAAEGAAESMAAGVALAGAAESAVVGAAGAALAAVAESVVVGAVAAPAAESAALAGAATGPGGGGAELACTAPAAGVIEFDRADLEAAIGGAGAAGKVRLRAVPLGGDRVVDLDLESFSVTGPRTRFVVGADNRPLEGFDPRGVTLLRGTVAGETGSHVYIALAGGRGAGHVALGAGGKRYVVGSGGEAAPGRVRIEIAEAPAIAGPGPLMDVPVCGVVEVPGRGGAEKRSGRKSGGGQSRAGTVPGTVPVSVAGGAPETARLVELAIDTDYEYFSLFGDAGDAAAYIVQLYGAVSDIYLRDVNARLEVVFVRLWDTPTDPYTDSDPLDQFVDEWTVNQGGVDRDVAQLLTGRRNLPYGGVAYVEALCSEFGYSVAGYILGAFADPDQPAGANWDLVVTAHELGHNAGTFHTQDYGIDNCAGGALQRGTIMSYCHILPGGNANIDLYFHAGTVEPMELFMSGIACLGHDCNGNGVDDVTDVVSLESTDVNGNLVPDECEDCNGNGTLDGADIAGGGSDDLNGNLVPDECEPDCNGNGVPDDRDIFLGTSLDAHGDGVPDECDADCDGDSVSDYNEIQLDMTLDIDRTATLDDCQDCDGDGTPDMEALGGAHNIWVAGQIDNAVSQVHAASGALALTSSGGALAGPLDVLVHPDGRVLVATANRVAQFDAGGAFLGNLVAAGSGGLSGAHGLALTPGGTLLVASNANNRVIEYDAVSGALIGDFVTAGLGGLSGPRMLRYGPDGNLYVSTGNNRVLEYDGTNGSFVGTFVAASSGGLTSARGLVFKPDGNLLVASFGTDQILEYDGATGASIGQWNHGGPTNGTWGLRDPWDIEIGPDGHVYVTSNAGNAVVQRYDVESGDFMRSFYVLAAAGPIAQPTGMGFVPGDSVDCNLNLLPDTCDIASGASNDADGNGVPDECDPVPGDLDGDGDVDVTDFLQLLQDWGPCPGPCPPSCAADLDGDCEVGIVDFLMLLQNWS